MIKICNIILSYLEENQKPFLAEWRLISIEKGESFFFQLSIRPHLMYFSAPVESWVLRTWNLKHLKTGLFLSFVSVIFGFLTQKNLPLPNFNIISKDDLNNSYYRKRTFKMADFTLEHPIRSNFQGLIISTLSTNSEKMDKILEVRVVFQLTLVFQLKKRLTI